jgi:hypothetical protein
MGREARKGARVIACRSIYCVVCLFERVILEELFTDFAPEIFLRSIDDVRVKLEQAILYIERNPKNEVL